MVRDSLGGMDIPDRSRDSQYRAATVRERVYRSVTNVQIVRIGAATVRERASARSAMRVFRPDRRLQYVICTPQILSRTLIVHRSYRVLDASVDG